MREGKVLTIQTEGMEVSFKLTGTRDAIAELAACVTENKTTEKVELQAGAAHLTLRVSGGRTASRYRRA